MREPTVRDGPAAGGELEPVLRILIVDDHGLTRTGMRFALEADHGFEIVGDVADGTHVATVVARTNPDVVLLDLRIPGVDGLQCLTRLRRTFPDVKVVMCSMSSDVDQIQTAFKRGACGYILKTINPGDLGSAIRQAVEGTVYHAFGLPGMDDASVARAAGLTERELEILKAVARGLSNKEIANELWVTAQTVKFHLTSIYRKLGVGNRTEAARWAMEKGLDTEGPV